MEKQVQSEDLREFIEEIKHKNRNPRKVPVLEVLGDSETNSERVLPIGTELFRCRIIDDNSAINTEENFFGYNAGHSFIPPANETRDMRANYRYIPYLYCANHPYTALVEVRPRLGARVSVATIRVNEEIKLLDFTMQTTPTKMTDSKKKLFEDLSMLYSEPIASDDDISDYIPTQYIAEYAKNLNYDGISFRSSLTPELARQDTLTHPKLDIYNIVVFNYSKCSAIKSNVFKIIGSHIDCKQIDADSKKLDIHDIAWDMYY